MVHAVSAHASVRLTPRTCPPAFAVMQAHNTAASSSSLSDTQRQQQRASASLVGDRASSLAVWLQQLAALSPGRILGRSVLTRPMESWRSVAGPVYCKDVAEFLDPMERIPRGSAVVDQLWKGCAAAGTVMTHGSSTEASTQQQRSDKRIQVHSHRCNVEILSSAKSKCIKKVMNVSSFKMGTVVASHGPMIALLRKCTSTASKTVWRRTCVTAPLAVSQLLRPWKMSGLRFWCTAIRFLSEGISLRGSTSNLAQHHPYNCPPVTTLSHGRRLQDLCTQKSGSQSIEPS